MGGCATFCFKVMGGWARLAKSWLQALDDKNIPHTRKRCFKSLLQTIKKLFCSACTFPHFQNVRCFWGKKVKILSCLPAFPLRKVLFLSNLHDKDVLYLFLFSFPLCMFFFSQQNMTFWRFLGWRSKTAFCQWMNFILYLKKFLLKKFFFINNKTIMHHPEQTIFPNGGKLKL